MRVDNNGMAMAVFDTQIKSSLACVIPAYNNALAFDVNIPGGRGLLAVMLSAKESLIYSTFRPNFVYNSLIYKEPNFHKLN